MTDALFVLRPWEAPEVTCWRRLPMNAVDRRERALSLDGPWRFEGIVNEVPGNCATNRPAIVEFGGEWFPPA